MALRVVFMGSDPIALPLLVSLGGAADVVGVFTQPDRPAGRGQRVEPNAIKSWALGQNLPVFQPGKLGPPELQQLKALAPDICLVMAYGHILRDEVIAVPRLGTLNLHTSILPKYRGASPIQTAVASGERETGVSLMRIVRKLDAGPVADVERVPIAALDTAIEVEAKLAEACIPLLRRNIQKLAAGELTFVPQDERSATFCRKLVKADGQLDFHAPAAVLAARINGLFPWPRCSIAVNGIVIGLGLADTVAAVADRRIDLPPSATASTAGPGTAGPGTILGADAYGLLVATGEGVLRLRRLQRPGGRMLEASEFLRGLPIADGAFIESAPMRVLLEEKLAGK